MQKTRGRKSFLTRNDFGFLALIKLLKAVGIGSIPQWKETLIFSQKIKEYWRGTPKALRVAMGPGGLPGQTGWPVSLSPSEGLVQGRIVGVVAKESHIGSVEEI